MIELMDTLLDAENIDPSFRIWITTEIHPQFPITLLQMSIKFTNEPPLGIKAGLKRTYTGESVKSGITKLTISLLSGMVLAVTVFESDYKVKNCNEYADMNVRATDCYNTSLIWLYDI